MSKVKNTPMDLVVISDLHLSTGCPDQDGKYSCNEDFFFDDEFSQFLQYLQKRKPGRTHLIIAGDSFDFLQIHGRCTDELLHLPEVPFPVTRRERNYGLGTEQEKAVWKVGVIADGHKVFFQALSRFLSKGNCLSILAGNHDIELYWEKVRRELVDRIAAFEKAPAAKLDVQERIQFYPWCYYDAEHKTYIEHGNQYDPLNAFTHLLNPVLAHDPKRLWLPFGSLFVRYFFNKLEGDHPFADNMKPATKYMQWVWREDKLVFLKNVILYLPLMLWMVLKGRTSSAGPDLKVSEQEQIDAVADRLGLPSDDSNPLRKIYALKVKPHTWRWFLNPAAYSTFFYIILSLIAFLALFFGFGFGFKGALLPFATLVIPAMRWLLQTETAGRAARWMFEQLPSVAKPLVDSIARRVGGDRLKRSLSEIKGSFAEAGIDIHTIITGHTHDRDMAPVDSTCEYFNTGTWTTVFSEEDRLVREPVQFTFVWIDMIRGKTRARLLQWDKYLGKARPVILLQEYDRTRAGRYVETEVTEPSGVVVTS